MPEFKLATRPMPHDIFEAPVVNSELSTFKLAKRQKPQTDSAFEAMRETDESEGHFQKNAFAIGARVTVKGREAVLLGMERLSPTQLHVMYREGSTRGSELIRPSELRLAKQDDSSPDVKFKPNDRVTLAGQEAILQGIQSLGEGRFQVWWKSPNTTLEASVYQGIFQASDIRPA